MRALLDVNLLVALFDPDHVFHDRAHRWWTASAKQGWASCPLTENGLVRVMSNPNYSKKERFSPIDLIARLRRTIAQTNHQFWPDDFSLCDAAVFDHTRLATSKLITDHYLLALATKRHARLATFDQAIPLSPVREANPSNLHVV